MVVTTYHKGSQKTTKNNTKIRKMRYIVEYEGGATETVRAGSDGRAERKAFEVAIEKKLPRPYLMTKIDDEDNIIKVIRIK